MLRITAELPVKYKKDFDRCLSHWECRNLESLIMSEFYVIMLFQLVLDPLSWYKFPAGLLVQQICTDGHDCRWGHGQSRLFLLLFFFFIPTLYLYVFTFVFFSLWDGAVCSRIWQPLWAGPHNIRRVQHTGHWAPELLQQKVGYRRGRGLYQKETEGWVIGGNGGYIKKRPMVGL